MFLGQYTQIWMGEQPCKVKQVIKTGSFEYKKIEIQYWWTSNQFILWWIGESFQKIRWKTAIVFFIVLRDSIVYAKDIRVFSGHYIISLIINFNLNKFEQWFMEVVLEYVWKSPGWYVLLGNNLTSHFNVDVVRVAEENNIHFVILPPNATHVLQPLDVAVFSSQKQLWRVILDEWKIEVRTEGAFNKQFFPLLLKRLINYQESCMQKSLQSGFRAYSIHPLQHFEPLSRLTSTSSLNVS